MPGKGKLRKVLTPKSLPARPASTEEGFTLIELVIVLLIMTIVIVVATGALISLSQTTNRGSAMITDEQQASTVITQLAKDIRSAHTISIPTGATASNQVILQDNNPTGGFTSVQWIYSQGGATLTRQVQNAQGVYQNQGAALTEVANSSTQPIFRYFNVAGTDISSSINPTIGKCTTRIRVDLVVSPQPGTTGVSNFEERADVAITDQLQLLSAPGNGQC
jgi:prepilin-type N-terminal cleavage/methylation domain-containing protein